MKEDDILVGLEVSNRTFKAFSVPMKKILPDLASVDDTDSIGLAVRDAHASCCRRGSEAEEESIEQEEDGMGRGGQEPGAINYKIALTCVPSGTSLLVNIRVVLAGPPRRREDVWSIHTAAQVS